jgi:hypothetical protein
VKIEAQMPRFDFEEEVNAAIHADEPYDYELVIGPPPPRGSSIPTYY